jgi:hypothetical protein
MPDYCNEVSLKLTPSGYITPNLASAPLDHSQRPRVHKAWSLNVLAFGVG